MKADPADNVIQIIESTIKLATPRDTFRGRKDRNRLVKQTLAAVKGMTYDKRMKGKPCN